LLKNLSHFPEVEEDNFDDAVSLENDFVDEYGIDLNDRAEVIKHIDHLNVLMGENI
jgi:hypothetical protein